MGGFFTKIIEFLKATQIPEQIQQVDAGGLFSNWYFLVPFILLIGYQLYKQAFNNIIVIGMVIGLWVFSGSSYVEGLIVNGELQMGKILPVAGVGLVAVAVFIYLTFMRSD